MNDSDSSRGLRARLAKTRRSLQSALGGWLGGAPDAATLDALHDQLLLADVGVEASERIINRLRRSAAARADAESVADALRAEIGDILAPCAQPLAPDYARAPFVILMVGVNGVGKTTTLAKLAAHLQRDGARVMLAACDTFRAAAVEQLQTWGRRLDAPVIAQPPQAGKGADAAAVAHDALASARARGVDALLIDTAGRQHTDDDLIAQLSKVARVLRKIDADAPHETLLCLDAGTGQNALVQAERFHQAVGVTGLCVTKLDGTAKGGIVIALAERLALPIRYLGVGEGAEDLRPFDAAEFAAALLAQD